MALGKAAIGIGLTAAFGMGVANRVGPAVREGAMEAAFGDPNADAAFLGRNVSARYLLGAAIGGPMGTAMQYSAPSDKFMVDPIRPTLANTTAMGVIGAGLGLGLGKMAGGSASRFAREALGRPKKGFFTGLPKAGGGGLKGAIIGGAAGLGIGAMTGAFAAPLAYTQGHVRRNQSFYRESPYNVSRMNAEALNASGDIVLGMHNSR